MPAVHLQGAVVRLDQPALPDGGHGLQMGQIGRPLRQTEPPDAGPDGPAAHQHDVPLLVHQPDDLLGDRRHAVLVERAVVVRQHARADLDHDGLRAGGNFLANGIEHGNKLR